MTRDELLNLLRRELSSREWSELRPGERLAELEARLDTVAERFAELRRDYDETSVEELLRALDDLAASASYLRTDVGELFSDATRLASDLRAALRSAEDDDAPRQLGLGAPRTTSGADTAASEESESRQRRLFE